MEKITATQFKIMHDKYKAGEMSKAKWERICEIVAFQAMGIEVEEND